MPLILMPLRLTEAASATDAAIHKKMFGSGYEEMNDVMKTVQSLEELGLLIKRVSEAIKYKAK